MGDFTNEQEEIIAAANQIEEFYGSALGRQMAHRINRRIATLQGKILSAAKSADSIAYDTMHRDGASLAAYESVGGIINDIRREAEKLGQETRSSK